MNIPKLLLLFFFLPFFAFSQTSTQSQQLTLLTHQFIALYNTGDTAQYRAFANSIDTTAASVAHAMGQFSGEQNFVGRVDVKNIQVVSPTETQTLVQTPRFETWWQVIVLTDSAQRYKEHHMRLLRVTNAVLGNRTLLLPELAGEIEGFIKRQAAYQPFNGNVLIQKDGKTIYQKSFGTATTGKQHQMQDRFDLASVGKLFTAIAILQLVDAHKLQLTDSVAALLPELKNKKLSSITIQQLLTHTSGMGDYFEDRQYQHIMDSMQAQRGASGPALYLPFFERDSLRFAPGKDWAYSNTGFELLGYILENVTGTPYKQYIATHILTPANMHMTIVGGGAGGGQSTVEDMARFAAALKGFTLISKPRTQAFFSYTVNGQYGWGSEHQTLAGETIVGHSGGFEKVCNEVNIYTKSGYTVIILSDTDPPYGHFLGDKIKTLLVQKSS